MSTRLRIATFNLENLDDRPDETPTLDERIAVMRPQLIRLDADVLCLQEIHGQKHGGETLLLALEKLLQGTGYEGYGKICTKTGGGTKIYAKRNLVVMSRYPIIESHQYKHDLTPAPYYKKVTADEDEAKRISWERPILHAQVRIDQQRVLHVINLHLKSRLPTSIGEQQVNNYTWKTASGWSEGFFLSSMKRVGQALETRMLIDNLFDADENALIVVCGDFNADFDAVPVEAIRGDIENTGNPELVTRVLVPCELTVPDPARYSLLHHGKGAMLDHLLASRQLLPHYRGSEIHNEILHDESIAFATDVKYPESDHAAVIAEFDLP